MAFVLITVLMTVYNGGRYLRQAVESVLKQDYSNFEFIIVDDNSNDGSFEILKDYYRDPRIRIIQNSANQGQTVSLNIGLRQARGDYIARIDADDIAFPFWLQSQVNFLKNNGEVDVLSAGLVVFNKNGIGKAYFSPSRLEDIILKTIIKSPINHGSALIKKDVILNIGGYNSNYKIAADYDLWTKFLKQNRNIISNPEILMAIRCHRDSESEKNRLTLVLKEFAEISRRYILSLTDMNLTEDEAMLMCRAQYDEGRLNKEDFLQAVEIHKNIYAALRLNLNLDKTRVKFWYKKQARTFFLKRIYWHIFHLNRLEVRATAKKCLEKLGFSAIFAGLYFFSFLPQLFLDFILKVYYFIHAAIAKVSLGGKEKIPDLKG